jgi:hypothetical protein
MPVTIHVNGSSNSLVHKGSNGIASSTIPDVCKTPSPAGPVPIPYPVIVSMSSDLENGSTTVKADGGNMIAIKDCDFSRCTGDEAGTAGGVASSTFGKEAKFILYSFDVKIDGGNACRLADKMTMNHQNTMCLGGVLQQPVAGLSDDEKKVADCLCNGFCDEVKRGFKKGPQGGYSKKKSFSKRHNWSHDLETNMKNNPPPCLDGHDVRFTDQSFTNPKTIPDANLRDPLDSNNVLRCFDFKFPGDRSRDTQLDRQQKLANDNECQIISTKTCKCS